MSKFEQLKFFKHEYSFEFNNLYCIYFVHIFINVYYLKNINNNCYYLNNHEVKIFIILIRKIYSKKILRHSNQIKRKLRVVSNFFETLIVIIGEKTVQKKKKSMNGFSEK